MWERLEIYGHCQLRHRFDKCWDCNELIHQTSIKVPSVNQSFRESQSCKHSLACPAGSFTLFFSPRRLKFSAKNRCQQLSHSEIYFLISLSIISRVLCFFFVRFAEAENQHKSACKRHNATWKTQFLHWKQNWTMGSSASTYVNYHKFIVNAGNLPQSRVLCWEGTMAGAILSCKKPFLD